MDISSVVNLDRSLFIGMIGATEKSVSKCFYYFVAEQVDGGIVQ